MNAPGPAGKSDEPWPSAEVAERYMEELGRGWRSASQDAQEWGVRFMGRCAEIRSTRAPARAMVAVCRETGLMGTPRERTRHTKDATERKKRALKHAVEIVSFGNETPWERCELVAIAMERFERDVWPKWKDRAEAPEEASALARALFALLTIGAVVEIPRTQGGIWRALGTYIRANH